MEKQHEPIVRARDVMITELNYIDGMATAEEAAEMMRQKGVDTLLVHKRHPDDAIGVVAVQDLITEVILSNRSPRTVNVYEVMTKPVISVPASMDIRYVVRLMVRAGIRRAPVEDGGEYIGMVSLTALILDKHLF